MKHAFKRKEEKFILPLSVADNIKFIAKQGMDFSEFNRDGLLTDIRTTYLENEEFLIYHMKKSHKTKRFKVRIREYGRNGKFENFVWIELKEKIEKQGYKSRFKIDKKYINDFINGLDIFHEVKDANEDIDVNYLTKYFTQKDLISNNSSSFNWKDVSARMFYRYPLTKELDLSPDFEYKIRSDSNNDKFSYQQFKPSLNLTYKNKKADVNLIGSYINRKYKTLEATDNNWTSLGKITYQYYQVKLESEYRLNKKLSLTLLGFLNNRMSNKTNINSIYFRGYDYYNISLGIKYRF